METLGDALPEMIRKVRDETLPLYEEIAKTSPLTNLTIQVIKHEMDTATRAMAEGDVVQMMRSYQSLKETYEA